jgi:DNA-directed RNA polymerase subunit H (RpoH/RPB5)
MDYLYRAKKTQIKMIMTRGFDVGNEIEILDKTIPEIRNFYDKSSKEQNISVRKAMSNIYTKDDIRLLVMYLDSASKKQLGNQAVSTFITEVKEKNCHQGIIIAPYPLTKEALEDLKKTTKSLVQFFLEIELNYDILSHFLNPKFEVISSTDFFKSSGLKPTQMPIIKSYDPVSKYLGLLPGSILKEYHTTLSGETMVDKYITFSIVQ